MVSDFRQYRRKHIAELRPYVPGEDLSGVSISAPDKESGSPKVGDMIARNPKNHKDQWLVAEQYFKDNFEPVEAENDAFQDAVVTGLGAVKMNADGSAERVDLRAEADVEGGVKALADALRGLLKAYENAFDWSAELPLETVEAERKANEVLQALSYPTQGRR